jgi:hypothetical protein
VRTSTSLLVRSMGLGSLTLILSDIELLCTLVGEVGVEGRSQFSNTLESRAWESDWRQSVDFVLDCGETSDSGRALPCLAVPSPPSSSSDDISVSWIAFVVESDGSSDKEDVERGRERRYHSSGTEKRKECLALAENGDGICGALNNS